MTPFPRIVSSREALDAAAVGGKLARQQVMATRGIRVPPFFCLTVSFFDEVFASIRDRVQKRLSEADFSDADSIRRASDDVRALFASLPLPHEREILAAFDSHFLPADFVAVRASTVGHRIEESEDSAQNPFAGMSETFLFVPKERVLEKVSLCLASGFSPESLLYRHAQGMDVAGFAVAVGVQAMIFGERSFVLFTCDPKTATRDVVIVAGYGVGEGVVQERVGVDHCFVNGRTGEIHREIGTKATRLAFDDVSGCGLTLRDVPEALRDVPCLVDDEVVRLVALGRTIERIFGAPQDIEGTITADGTIHVVQSRPVAIDWERVRVWTNANVTESFPGVTTALTYSFARFFYRVIFYDCYRRLGIGARALHANHEGLDRMIGFLGGRIYYCLTSFYDLHSQSPLFPIFRASWEKMMGFRTSYDTTRASLLSRAFGRVRAVAQLAGACVTIAARYFTHERAMRRFHVWWEDLYGPFRGRDFSDEDPFVLENRFHRVWREVGEEWGITLLNDTYLPVLYGLTESIFAWWELDEDDALLSELLCGGDELLSVEIVLSAVRLAEIVRSDAALRRAFDEQTPADLWRAIEREELSGALSRAFRQHLHRYGDRGLAELKIEQPNLRDTPWLLVESVKTYASGDVTVEAIRARERAARARGETRLAKALKRHPIRRFVLGRLLAAVRRLIRNRENSRYARSELFGFSKRVFRAIGAHLAERGVLRDPADHVHLEKDELFGWIDGTGVTGDLKALADLRKKEHAARMAFETPMEATTLGAVGACDLARPDATREAPNGERLCGLGSSAGKARGRARVVLDANAATASLGADAILVARETDPGWLFLMLASKGIVVERGSMLSHTAITGRKFGIPTIVSLPNATTRIPDGALIEIDGASGVVTLLEEP